MPAASSRCRNATKSKNGSLHRYNKFIFFWCSFCRTKKRQAKKKIETIIGATNGVRTHTHEHTLERNDFLFQIRTETTIAMGIANFDEILLMPQINSSQLIFCVWIITLVNMMLSSSNICIFRMQVCNPWLTIYFRNSVSYHFLR